jgi:CDP-diacylglycerol--glycerol-3-phosphate 3-phosphatidyltransferase
MNEKINIPNSLSMLRILMIPVLVALIIHSSAKNYPLLIGLFFVTIILDFFDGFLARKLSQETELGKILDPLADKLLITFTIVALIIKSDFPLWLALIIFSRDLLIMGASALMFKGKHTVTPSILIGKITFGILGTLLLIYIIDLYEHLDLEILKRFFTVLSFSFLVWSWVEYYNVFIRFTREKNAR